MYYILYSNDSASNRHGVCVRGTWYENYHIVNVLTAGTKHKKNLQIIVFKKNIYNILRKHYRYLPFNITSA